jgi:hypothetical protein
MGHQEQQRPAIAPVVVPRVVPRATARADGLEAVVHKAGPVLGQAGWMGKGDGEPPKEPPKADPPKGEDPPKEPPKKDPPKDPKLGRLGRPGGLDRMTRVLADKDIAVPPKPKSLVDDVVAGPDRLGRP